jgi:hypothetical protein
MGHNLLVEPPAALFWPLVLVTALQVGCGKFHPDESRWNRGLEGGFHFSSPTISSDGSIIAFDTDATGSGDIYVCNRDGSQSRRLTADPAIERMPVLSPDGSRIAFAKQTGGYQHIVVVEVTGSNAHPVTVGKVVDFPVAFLTNNQDLLFVRLSKRGPSLMATRRMYRLAMAQGSPPQIECLGEVSAVTEDENTALQESFDRATGQQTVYCLERTTGRKRLVGYGALASLNRDGAQVVYIRSDARFMQYITIWHASDGSTITVPAPAGNKSQPRFCLNDQAVIFRVFDSERDGLGGAFLIHLRDVRLERLPKIEGGAIR